MAHMVETMAYAAVNGAPWHKLGVPVSADLTPAEILTAAGLDWTVEKKPVYQLWDGAYVTVDGKFNLTRMTDGKVLDVVGSRYNPTQNAEAVEFFTEFVAAGDMRMDTAVSLEGGRRTWALASIQDGFTLAGGDRVNGYLLLSSPHREGETFHDEIYRRARGLQQHNHRGAKRRRRHLAHVPRKTVRRGHASNRRKLRWAWQKPALMSSTKRLSSWRLPALTAHRRLSNTSLRCPVRKSWMPWWTKRQPQSAVAAGGSVLDAILAGHTATAVTRAIRETDLNRAGRMILESSWIRPVPIFLRRRVPGGVRSTALRTR